MIVFDGCLVGSLFDELNELEKEDVYGYICIYMEFVVLDDLI